MNKKFEIQSLPTPKSSRIDVIGWNSLLKKKYIYIYIYHVQGYMTHVFLIKSRTKSQMGANFTSKITDHV